MWHRGESSHGRDRSRTGAWLASGTRGSGGKPRRILTLVDHYPPAYKAGGPLRSVSNLVERLGDELEF